MNRTAHQCFIDLYNFIQQEGNEAARKSANEVFEQFHAKTPFDTLGVVKMTDIVSTHMGAYGRHYLWLTRVADQIRIANGV
jgi:plasmid stabilization system protein ParE